MTEGKVLSSAWPASSFFPKGHRDFRLKLRLEVIFEFRRPLALPVRATLEAGRAIREKSKLEGSMLELESDRHHSSMEECAALSAECSLILSILI